MTYADTGRASVAPKKLPRALLFQVFYSMRSAHAEPLNM